uniref:Uncharacterized protein n=1 Tax=Moniliophthora roreri TaxID=221103 RepID=A0A0W0GA63_MONRR
MYSQLEKAELLEKL